MCRPPLLLSNQKWCEPLLLRAFSSAMEAHEVLGPLVIQRLPLLAAFKLTIEAILVTIQENLPVVPCSQRVVFLQAVEYFDHLLPKISTRISVSPRESPLPSKLFATLNKEHRTLFCDILNGHVFDFVNPAHNGQIIDSPLTTAYSFSFLSSSLFTIMLATSLLLRLTLRPTSFPSSLRPPRASNCPSQSCAAPWKWLHIQPPAHCQMATSLARWYPPLLIQW